MFKRNFFLIISSLYLISNCWGTNIDSLKTILSNSKSTTEHHAKLNYEIAKAYYQEKTYDSAAIYANNAVNIFKTLSSNTELQGALELYSKLLKVLSFNNKLIPIQQELIMICKSNHDSIALMNAYDQMGIIYYHTNVTDSAIYYYQKSYEIGKLLKNNETLINSYNNFSQVYSYYGDHEKELEYCKKGLELATKTASLAQQGTFYHNAALAFINLGKLDSAQHYVEKAIEINTRIGDTDRIGVNKTALGNILCLKGDILKGMENFQEVLSYSTQTGNLFGETESNYNLGFSYYYLKNYQLALKYTFESLRNAKKAHLTQYQADNYELISNIYRGKNDYKRALNYFDKYYHLKDSIKNNTNITLISKIQSEYEYENNIHKIELLQKENEIKEKQIKSTLSIIVIVSISLLILGTILYFLYKKYKRNQELSSTLAKQYQAVQDSNDHLGAYKNSIRKDLEVANKLQNILIDNTKLLQQYFVDVTFENFTQGPVKSTFLWTHKLENKLIWVIININQQNIKAAFTSMYLLNMLEKVIHDNLFPEIELFTKSFFNKGLNKSDIPLSLDQLSFCFCSLDTKKQEIEIVNYAMNVELLRNAKIWDFKPNFQPSISSKLNIPVTLIQLQKKDNIIFFNKNWIGNNKSPENSYSPVRSIINKDALIPSKISYEEYLQNLKSSKNTNEFIFLSLIY